MRELIERLEKATGPDKVLDSDIQWHFSEWENLGGYYVKHKITGEIARTSYPEAPSYTGSLDAAVALVERCLPGWWWKVGTCCVSDDACIAPDFNSPIRGERLKAQFFPLTPGSEFDAGFDVDRRPSGNVPIALLIALLRALTALEKEEGNGP